MAIENRIRQLTKKFMEKIHSETGFPVLIYDRDGRIIQATDESRVNNIHPGAIKMMKEGKKEYLVTPEQANKNPLLKEGYSRAITSKGKVAGGFGITGSLAIAKPIGRTAGQLIDTWLDELHLHEELEERVRERTLILKQEIEARKQAEKILEENQARFEAFTRAIPDILFVFDQDGRYVEIFTFSQDLLYDEFSNLKGKLIQDVLPPDVAQMHHTIIKETAESKEIRHFEYELDVPKGKCWFESRTAPILGLEGDKKLVASSVRDITRRKLSEKEISEKQKLSVVIETAGAVCHEFNQPLQVIIGCCELLKTYSKLDSEVNTLIDKISKEARRMGELNKSLLNITSYKTKSYLESKIIDIDKSSSS